MNLLRMKFRHASGKLWDFHKIKFQHAHEVMLISADLTNLVCPLLLLYTLLLVLQIQLTLFWVRPHTVFFLRYSSDLINYIKININKERWWVSTLQCVCMCCFFSPLFHLRLGLLFYVLKKSMWKKAMRIHLPCEEHISICLLILALIYFDKGNEWVFLLYQIKGHHRKK